MISQLMPPGWSMCKIEAPVDFIDATKPNVVIVSNSYGKKQVEGRTLSSQECRRRLMDNPVSTSEI
jgi:hypothetical protein